MWQSRWIVVQGAFPLLSAVLGQNLQGELEALGSCKEVVIITPPFVVRGLIEHCLWKQGSLRGGKVKLVEACGKGLVGHGKSFQGCLVPGVLVHLLDHVGVGCLLLNSHCSRVQTHKDCIQEEDGLFIVPVYGVKKLP